MFTDLLTKLIARQNLSQEEARALLDALLSEEATDGRIAAALIAMAAKGETEEELAGFALAMRARSARIDSKYDRFIDTCGTGGSAVKTFNVSTAAAFVVAACGLPVAKHGNNGVTSKAGSADVLRALGVKVELPPVRVREIFDSIGLCFMFAPLHHAATKRVAMVRRELGVRTIFNLLGPLTNPAGAPYQLAGVSNEAACENVARGLSRLGARKAWVIRGKDGLDEITLYTETVVYEASPEGVRRFEISPEDFGIRRVSLEGLRGETAEANADVIRGILSGDRRDTARDLVLVNAAASLYLGGVADKLSDSVAIAAEAIDTGRAAQKLDALRVQSNQPLE